MSDPDKSNLVHMDLAEIELRMLATTPDAEDKPETTQPNKTCMSCRFRYGGLAPEYSKCLHPELQDSAGLELPFCVSERRPYYGRCGTDGKYWEQRPPNFFERILMRLKGRQQ